MNYKIGNRIICNEQFHISLKGYKGIITAIDNKCFWIQLDKKWGGKRIVVLFSTEFEYLIKPYQQLMLFDI
jgi:hypothetical protein